MSRTSKRFPVILSNVLRTSNLRSRVPFVSPPRFSVSPPVSPLVVTVPRPSIVSRWESTSVWSTCTLPLRSLSKSPPSPSNPELRLRSPLPKSFDFIYLFIYNKTNLITSYTISLFIMIFVNTPCLIRRKLSVDFCLHAFKNMWLRFLLILLRHLWLVLNEWYFQFLRFRIEKTENKCLD